MINKLNTLISLREINIHHINNDLSFIRKLVSSWDVEFEMAWIFFSAQ